MVAQLDDSIAQRDPLLSWTRVSPSPQFQAGRRFRENVHKGKETFWPHGELQSQTGIRTQLRVQLQGEQVSTLKRSRFHSKANGFPPESEKPHKSYIDNCSEKGIAGFMSSDTLACMNRCGSSGVVSVEDYTNCRLSCSYGGELGGLYISDSPAEPPRRIVPTPP